MPNTQRETLVFVYGTLKRGYGNNRLLQMSSCMGEYVTTAPIYKLTHAGIPYVQLVDNGFYLVGELFGVNDETLARLDALEGHPDWYRRELIDIEPFLLIQRIRWTTKQAWIYLQPRDLTLPGEQVLPTDYYEEVGLEPNVLIWNR